MILNLLKVFLLIIIILPKASLAEKKEITNEEYVNAIYLAVQRAWPVMENVWDTTMYRKIRLIVADDHNAWAIDSNSITKISYDEIQQRHLPVDYMHYQEIQYPDGRPTIYISLGAKLPPEEIARFQSERKPVPFLFNLATHEAFHFFVQANAWNKVSPNHDTRATAYPIQTTARFYRNSIIRALYSSLQGDPHGLGHARYWFDLWTKSYPDDAANIRQSDIDEGSARYIEIAAEIIAQGNDFDTIEFRRSFIEKIKDDADSIYTSADSESYPIGAISGLILDIKKMKWKSKVAQGEPPLDILLESISVIKDQIDYKLQGEVNQESKEINKKVGFAIDNFVKAYDNPNVTRIFVSSELSGSYSLSDGFFRVTKFPHDIMVGVSSAADWPNGNYSATEVTAAAIDDAQLFEGKRGFLILYAGKLPPPVNGRLILKTKRFSLNISYPYNIEKTRLIYLP